MATRNDTRIPFRKPLEFELNAALDRIRQAHLYQATPRPQPFLFAIAVVASFLSGFFLGRGLRRTEEIAVDFEPDERARLVAQVEEFLKSGDCPDYWLEDSISLLKKLRGRP